ncbi:MAG: alpha/beta fold hydrolase [Rhodococcus sp. (in: high G+C Gram-positive bacteria)]
MSETLAVVLVHGLWHGAWCWQAVTENLRERGIDVVALDLPLTALDDDVDVALAALDELGRPALLVGHSYGGAVITDAGAHTLARRLLYVAAYQLDTGESVGRALTERTLPISDLGSALRVDRVRNTVALDPVLGPSLLYSDADPDIARESSRQLRPVARALFRGVPTHISWRSMQSTYLVCGADRVVHPDLQRAMAERASARLEWNCGHSPALTRPVALADLIAATARL